MASRTPLNHPRGNPVRNLKKKIKKLPGLIAGNDEFPCQRAKTLEEACKLVEADFEYITGMDGGKMSRKRK